MKTKTVPCVWVVEMLVARKRGDQWEPCSDVSLSRDESKPLLVHWNTANPHDEFRIRKYIRSWE